MERAFYPQRVLDVLDVLEQEAAAQRRKEGRVVVPGGTVRGEGGAVSDGEGGGEGEGDGKRGRDGVEARLAAAVAEAELSRRDIGLVLRDTRDALAAMAFYEWIKQQVRLGATREVGGGPGELQDEVSDN